MCTRELEMRALQAGFLGVMGVDEAGRGCLAGPVVAAACMLPAEFKVDDVKDSKKLTTEKKREKVFAALMAHPGVIWGVGICDAATVDRLNILQATFLAMKTAIDQVRAKAQLGSSQCFVYIDGNQMPRIEEKAECVVKGDSKCTNIAAASVIAKVTRDRMMNEYHKEYPEWNFIKHKGYGSAKHMAMVKEGKWTPLHRQTFNPLKTVLSTINS